MSLIRFFLLDKLRRTHVLACNAEMHDGPAAFAELCAKYSATHIETTEARKHDDYLFKLRFTPLPENCEPARFEKRVS